MKQRIIASLYEFNCTTEQWLNKNEKFDT